MTLSFASILPEHHRNYERVIMLKGVAKTHYLTPGLTLEITPRFGSHLKAEMSVLTKVTGKVKKLISSFFFSPFHKISRLLLDVISQGTFFIGMAHSLSLSCKFWSC